MQTKDLLGTALQQSYGLVMPLLEDLKSAALVAPTLQGGNHAHWILGHFVVSEGQFRAMMRGIPNPVEQLKPFFGGGSTPDPAGSGYPTYDELLAKLVGLRQETMAWLEPLSESDLDQVSKVVPPGFEPFFGTWRSCLLMQPIHWMNHRGQLADCQLSEQAVPYAQAGFGVSPHASQFSTAWSEGSHLRHQSLKPGGSVAAELETMLPDGLP